MASEAALTAWHWIVFFAFVAIALSAKPAWEREREERDDGK